MATEALEELRIALSNRRPGKPVRAVLELVCNRAGHQVLWLVPLEDGLLPVTIRRGSGPRVVAFTGENGTVRARTLRELGTQDTVEVGPCACGSFAVVTAGELRGWLEQGLRKVPVKCLR